MNSLVEQAAPWCRAARPIAYGMLALPLLWGQALALLLSGQFHWHWLITIQVYAAVVQVYILYLNDYADEAVDKLNTSYWLSGGSRVIPDGQLSGKQLYKASFIALTGIVSIAFACSLHGRPWMLLLAAAAVLAAHGYSLKPLQASYRGYGELWQGLSCGVLLPITAFYLQAGSLHGFPWPALPPIFLLFFAGNIVTALPDIAADGQGGKLTYPVRHGKTPAQQQAIAILALSYGLGFFVAGQLMPVAANGWLIFGPAFAMLACAAILSKSQNRDALKPYIILVSLSQLWVLILWTALLFYRGSTSL